MKSDININNKDCLLNWKEFEISRLFTIKSPAARTIKSYSEGKTPYVSSGSFNNGIVSYLEPMADEKIEKGQCITVSPLDGSAFFQEEDLILSILVDTFISKISFPMQPGPEIGSISDA